MSEKSSDRLIAYLCGAQSQSKEKTVFRLNDVQGVEDYLAQRFFSIDASVYEMIARFGKFTDLYDPSLADIAKEYHLDVQNAITEKEEELRALPDDKLIQYAEKVYEAQADFHLNDNGSTGQPQVFEIYDQIENTSLIKAFSFLGQTKWIKPENESPLAQLNPKTPKDLPDIALVRGIKGLVETVLVNCELDKRLGNPEGNCKTTLKAKRRADLFPGRRIEPEDLKILKWKIAELKKVKGK